MKADQQHTGQATQGVNFQVALHVPIAHRQPLSKESSLAGGWCIESRKKPFLQIFTFVVVPGRGRTHSGLPPR
jgi:hypothetical protein